MEIIQSNSERRGMFEAILDNQKAGLMTYTWASPEVMIIDHTEVDDAFGGMGIGKKLVLAAIDFARKENKKIIPLCPYAKSVFDRNADLHDVLN